MRATVPHTPGDGVIAALFAQSRVGVSDAEFEQHFLPALANAVEGAAVAVWFTPDREKLYLRHQWNAPVAELQQDLEGWRRHGRLLRQVAEAGQACCVSPASTPEQSSDAANPTGWQLLIGTAPVSGGQHAIVEVFRRDDGRPVPEFEDLLATAAECVANRLRAGQLVGAARERAQSRTRDQFALEVHTSLDPVKTAYLAANSGRSVLGCDRVSILLRHRGEPQLTAVSGQSTVNRRANVAVLMERLAKAVLDGKEPVVLSDSVRQCPAAADELARAYAAESGARTLFVVPLRVTAEDPRPPGVLVVEQFHDAAPTERLVDGVNLLSAHAAVALQNAREHDRVFLRSARTWLGRQWGESLRLRRLVWLGLLAGVAAVLTLVTVPLRIHGDGVLRAEHRRGVFAPDAGTVRQLSVRHGDPVQRGQTIAVLESTQLTVDLQQVQEELISARETRKLKEAERLSSRDLAPQRQVQLDGEIAELSERITGLERRSELLRARVAALSLQAPIDGVIATWEPEKQLLNRPVQTGQLLLQIIAETGPWSLEVRVPEDDSGYVLDAWRKRSPESRLPVEYVLATHPERRYRGWLAEVAPRTERVGIEHVVYVTIVPDEGDPPPLRDGAEVRAKVHCGDRTLGYVLFREVVDFVHSRVLFLF